MKAKNIIFYGFFAVMAALIFASCNPDPEPKPTHTHDYGTVWKSNATQHWKECSCGDKKDIANHTSGDWIVDQAATETTAGSKHKECTLCGYETATETIPATSEGHTHDYGTVWKSNVTQHWHECSCGDKTDVANHTGDPCTVCGYASGNADITYTAEQTGGTNNTANTTGIVFTFSASVTGLTADHISVASGNGSLTKGALSGSGTSWTLGVSVTTAGNITIAIAKTGIEAEPKDVTVFMEGQANPTLDSISAVYTQGSTIIYPNTQLNALKADLTVTATYNTGAPQQVTAYSLSGTLTVGTSAVTVTFEGKITTFTVNVTAAPTAKTLTGITLNTGTVKKDYNQDETLNLNGLIVTANYSDGSSATVTTYTTSPTNGSTLSTTGTITVTVNYTEGGITQSKTFTVTVALLPTPGLAYELIDNGTAYRVRKGTVTGGAVVIPATYEGLPVTEIGDDNNSDVLNSGAFYGTNITSITIPSSVTTIGFAAFYGTNITSITIPASVTSIGNTAFSGCTGLTEITIPDSVTAVGWSAFSNCTNLQTIYVEGFTNQAAADAAWGEYWRSYCNAVIVYGIVSEIVQLNRTVFITGEQPGSIAATVRYSDNTTGTVAITVADITGFDSTTTGTKTLTVTYRGKTAQFTITVVDNNIITSTAEWNNAITLLNGANGNVTLTIGGSFNVAGSTNNTFGNGSSALTVTLKGSGTLSLSSQGNMLRIGAGQTLIIDSADLTLQGLKSGQNGATQNNNASLVYVSDSTAKLELRDGTIRDNFYNSGRVFGGGVCVIGGTFTMNGGTISGNRCSSSGVSSSHDAYGGGVYVFNGTFTMNGGTISGNTADAIADEDYFASVAGGGVYVFNGTFTMNGGTISGNTASVSVSRSANKTLYASACGGGVHVGGNNNGFTMNGGTISGNTATSSTSGSGGNLTLLVYGGGVYVDRGTFRIVTGTVYGSNETDTSLRNTAPTGTALYVYSDSTGTSVAQRGTFNGETWVSAGTLTTTNDTISVVNGE